MKVAVVYNRGTGNVINLFGMPNREAIGLQTIGRIVSALKAGGHHQVVAMEGDKDLVDRLEEFMPRVVKGERPGLVFNVSYGVQGQARYTHVPSILEMVGIPYVASGPLAHSLWCARQTGEGWPVKVRRKEGVTNHLHPESCAGRCEAPGEALTGARTGRAIEHRKRGGLERRDYHSGRRPHRHHRAG